MIEALYTWHGFVTLLVGLFWAACSITGGSFDDIWRLALTLYGPYGEGGTPRYYARKP